MIASDDAIPIWISVVEVRPRASSTILSSGEAGAFVKIVCPFHTIQECVDRIRKAMDDYELDVVAYNDWQFFQYGGEWDDALRLSVQEARTTGQLRMLSFHTFPPEND